MLTLEPFSEDQGRSAVQPTEGIPPISFLAPYGFTRPLTRTHVRLLGPCFKTGRMESPLAGAGSAQMPKHAKGARCQPRSRRRRLHRLIDCLGFGLRPNPHRSTPRVDWRTGLGRNLPPDWGCIPKQPDSPTAPRGATGSEHDGALTLSGAPFQGTWARSVAEDASPDYNSNNEIARFSSWAVPGSLAVTRGILTPTPPENGQGRALFVRFFLGAFCAGVRCLTSRRTRCPKVPCASARKGKKWKARQLGHDPHIIPQEYKRVRGFSAWQVFDNDPSAGSPTETLLRLLLPLNDKVQWTSRDVAGSEPPTSPRSEHFTGPFNR
ncbi:hypothetical protein Vadar_029215 [Vaccinium darrowii]|uniref:Uncharacterized protein n=1 Tax=Vaccinium darrowii TaxID=229202 RepID=A0ACB7XD52_9ERIC|nr:hypothetical protein Vadar_029215 [Vaccinium darrowii]